MKKSLTLLLTFLLTLSLAACGTKEEYDPTDDICPGKQPGVAGNEPVRAEGFDSDEDMSFETKDCKGNIVTNEIFSGTEHGVWMLFWETSSKKSVTELQTLNSMVDIAAKNGYKILGVVIDGEKNEKKAAEMTADLNFDNIIWNDSMAVHYPGIEDFFTKEYYEENKENFQGLDPMPALGNPVSTRTNSRGQVQTSCFLVPMEKNELERIWENNDSNASYEELIKQGEDIIKGGK